LDIGASWVIKLEMARNLILPLAFLFAGTFAPIAQARLGWTLAQSVQVYGPYKTAMKDMPGYLPGTVYGFLDKTADLNNPQLDYVIESYLDGKVGLVDYSNSDHTPLKPEAIQVALLLNAPKAEWSINDKFYVGKESGEIKYMGGLHDGGTSLTIGTAEYFTALNARKDANAAIPEPQSTPATVPIADTNVVSAITENRWTSYSLIVSGTLTNTSAVAVKITGIEAIGFSQDQKMLIRGSDYTVLHNDLSPGETVNFKLALKDAAKQIKFVKVMPSWLP
jgi:hypothetical protein